MNDIFSDAISDQTMLMDPELIQKLNCITGYLELGMPEMALEEMERLSSEEADLPDALHLKCTTFMMLGKFMDVVAQAQNAIKNYPENCAFYMHACAALSALQRGEEARLLWESAPHAIQETGVFHFNIACFEIELGNLPNAKRHLKNAIRISPEVIRFVQDEPRLKKLLSSTD